MEDLKTLPDDIVDAHHHLWDLDALHYPWLMAKGVKRFFGDPTPIQNNYLVTDLLADAKDLPLKASVHIQVGVSPEQSVAESRWLQQVADNSGYPQSIVAFVDLSAPNLEATLKQQQAFANFRGVRQIVGRSAREDAASGTAQLPDNPRWRQGLSQLAAAGLSFDLQLIPEQMLGMAEILKRLPELQVALCHCGSPWDRSDEGINRWQRGLQALSQLPNVHCKISGLGMYDHQWTTESIRPFVLRCIDYFGVERCMFGSNFPVDKLYGPYHSLWQSFSHITADLRSDERQRLFADNARNFYRTQTAN